MDYYGLKFRIINRCHFDKNTQNKKAFDNSVIACLPGKHSKISQKNVNNN